MRILILSCNTGEGHNACARAVREALLARGAACDIVDGLRFVSPVFSLLVSRWHVRLYRYLPRFYCRAYDYAERHAGMMDQSALVCRLLGLGCRRLRAFIAAGGYDAVLCTHLFPMMMLTRLCQRESMGVRTGFIATDYTASPGCGAIAPDWCFIPDASLTEEFAAAGIDRARIVPSGIPVRAAFAAGPEGPDDRPGVSRVLLMSGSMGCGPIRRLVDDLYAQPGEMDISVICGSNRRLERQLKRRFGASPRVHVFGRVEDVPRRMDEADLYLTKPGGISVTEACAKGLPMLLIPVVGGCEGHNLRYHVDAGAARAAGAPPELARLAAELLSGRGALDEMAARRREIRHENAAQIICDTMMTGEYHHE